MGKSLSAAKRERQNVKRYLKNRGNRSALRTAMRKFDSAVAQGPDKGAAALSAAFKALDVAARKGSIPKGRADRKKARLALKVKRAKAGPAPAAPAPSTPSAAPAQGS